MKKYVLMLGIAAVSIGSYCAYAGNSATMTVTATITHDVSLNVSRAFDIGKITFNPSYSNGGANFDGTTWTIDENAGIMSISGTRTGLFTANIPNPSTKMGLSIESETMEKITLKDVVIDYVSDNVFRVFAARIWINQFPSEGACSGTINIKYTPE
ncbi:MAG: hypothetical protein IJ689_03905 [Alphaproteobacteria bacterium]|nr:hypothetical protein [Alphaproteobacteria bacterium]